MDKAELTREQLLQRVMELEMLTKDLLAEKEREASLDFAWTGNLGHWYWNVITNSVVFNPMKVVALGYTMEELPAKVGYQFFTDKLPPEDYPRVMKAMVDHLEGAAEVYEVEYRIQAKAGTWKWFYDRGKITQRDAAGKPSFVSGIVFDITDKKEEEMEIRRSNEHLQRENHLDSLTGILNRRGLAVELARLVEGKSRQADSLAVGMFDIDYFKRVNDSKGHSFGDEVLKQVANLLVETVREKDIVGRYGGEEFLVIFPETSIASALAVAERIRLAVAENDCGGGLRVTISGGLAEHLSENANQLIDLADQQLYKAKHNGRNQVTGESIA